MRPCACLIPLLALMLILGACEQTPNEPTPAPQAAAKPEPAEPKVVEDATPGEMVATGVFLGRSGKPMSGAKLVLGTISGDLNFPSTQIDLVGDVQTATTDKDGKFQIKGFKPGKYTIVYQPRGAVGLMPQQLRVKSLGATMRSIAPGLPDTELGTTNPFSSRAWGSRYTLMEGHTLFTKGNDMSIWNATVRSGGQGPYIEFRRSQLWTTELEDNCEIQFEAWSY